MPPKSCPLLQNKRPKECKICLKNKPLEKGQEICIIRHRKKIMHDSFSQLQEWGKERNKNKNTCVVCGETMRRCLDVHHNIDEYGNKTATRVKLCGSCHRMYDTSKVGEKVENIIKMFQVRHNSRQNK